MDIPHDNLAEVSLDRLMQADNWQAKYRLITDWGTLISHKANLRLNENLVKGCETKAWLVHRYHNGQHLFLFDSDSRVMNGLAALLLSQINHQSTLTIQALDVMTLLTSAGLHKHLTPSRNNGFARMVERARALAQQADAT